MKQPSQPGIVLRRAIEHSGEALERFLGQCKIAPIQKHRFGFSARRFEHEIRSAPTKRLCRTVNQNLLVPAGAQIYCFAAPGPAFRYCFWHRPSVSTQLVYKIVMTL